MRKFSGSIALRMLGGVVLALIVSTQAAAEYREYSGKVVEISGDKLTIANRQGDRVSFQRSEATVVTGAKSRWQAVAAGDRVSVSWKMVDAPRIAYKVVVLPPEPASRD